MLANLIRLFRYRGLVQILVTRELKARYRGSVLGFFWSFVNPLLLLLVYSFVFTAIIPRGDLAGLEPYAVFLFCGLLPWTWFSSSLNESANVLIVNGNLIKKVVFPVEILPVVAVASNLCHFVLGLPILFVILANREYRILKHNLDIYRHRFGVESNRPYREMDLIDPPLGFVEMAAGMGVAGRVAGTLSGRSTHAARGSALASTHPTKRIAGAVA